MTPDEAVKALAKHESLCWWAAKRVGPEMCHQDQEDLAAAAREQLLRAVKTFDPSAGNTFVTYSLRGVLGQVRRAARRIRARGAKWVPTGEGAAPVTLDLDGEDGAGLVNLIAAPTSRGGASPDDFWDLVATVLNGSRLVCVLSRFRDDLTLREVGERLGISKERARQLTDDGVERLRGSGLFTSYICDAA